MRISCIVKNAKTLTFIISKCLLFLGMRRIVLLELIAPLNHQKKVRSLTKGILY